MNEWIDAKDRKPKSGVEVLGVITTEDMSAEYVDIMVYSQRGYWLNATSMEAVSRITHWMPLPELPNATPDAP